MLQTSSPPQEEKIFGVMKGEEAAADIIFTGGEQSPTAQGSSAPSSPPVEKKMGQSASQMLLKVTLGLHSSNIFEDLYLTLVT